MYSNCLVVLSNSKYADLWETLIESYNFHNYFCKNFDLFISTDSFEGYENLNGKGGFKFLLYPSNLAWSGALKYIVKYYLVDAYRYVIFTFDDLYITKIDSLHIKKILARNFTYYKLLNTHINIYNLYKCNNCELNLKNAKDTYIGSLVFTVFQMTYFNEALSKMPDGLNPWEYEIYASRFLRVRNSFFCSQRNLIVYQNLVIKGKVNPVAKKVIQKYLGKKFQLKRKEMGFADVAKYYLKYFIWHLFREFVPFHLQKVFRKKH